MADDFTVSISFPAGSKSLKRVLAALYEGSAAPVKSMSKLSIVDEDDEDEAEEEAAPAAKKKSRGRPRKSPAGTAKKKAAGKKKPAEDLLGDEEEEEEEEEPELTLKVLRDLTKETMDVASGDVVRSIFEKFKIQRLPDLDASKYERFAKALAKAREDAGE